MKVKHKDAKKSINDPSMVLSYWYENYYPNKKYLNYEFYDVPEIFDVYEIDEKTGALTYMKSDFSSAIMPFVKNNPSKYVYKPHNSKYLDEYLMPRKKFRLERFKTAWYYLPKLKSILENTFNSKISKELWFIIRGVLILIIAYTLWALFENSILNQFK